MAGLRVHHIGVVVKGLEPALKVYVTLFSGSLVRPAADDPLQQAHIGFVSLPGNQVLVELIAPYAAGAPVASFLQHRGGGLHHVCYAVRDIDAVREDWRANGAVPVFGPAPAVAFGGRRILFVYLRDRSLVELVEGDLDDDPIELLAEG